MIPPGEVRFRTATADNRNLLVPWYLMASYAYYHRDESLLLDATYDQLCVALDAEWDNLEHPHKHLVDRASLAAGTGFRLGRGDYPWRVVGAACALLGLPYG